MHQNKNIQKLRKEIDCIDNRIVNLLERRLRVIKKISGLKKKNNIAVFDKEREVEIIKNVKSKTSPEFREFVSAVFEEILTKSKQAQRTKKR
jgi:monofunctional chorismate mutase